jgi:hypothetical protein
MDTKKQTGIWIDSSKAIIITLSGAEPLVQEVDADIENSVYHHHEGDKGSFMGERHLNNDRKFEERKHQQIKKYLQEIIELIGTSDEIFVFGPAQMKFELKTLLEESKLLKNKLLAVETVDKMTVNQVKAKMMDFFKK